LSEPRGFGDRQTTIRIFPDSFAAMAQTMMHANPEAAIKAFGAALAAGTPQPCKVWYPGIDDPPRAATA
jgi:hypothetical protein